MNLADQNLQMEKFRYFCKWMLTELFVNVVIVVFFNNKMRIPFFYTPLLLLLMHAWLLIATHDYALVLKYRHCFMCLKCLRVNLAERSKFTNGEIQTFMSVDADRTVNLCNSFHDMWRYSLFNLNFLMPIGFTIFFFLLS